jgi:hypothetical protein
MSVAPSNPPAAPQAQTEWDETTIRKLHRHMRINYRYLSAAVRQMTLQQCLVDVPPSMGEDVLLKRIEKKLTL